MEREEALEVVRKNMPTDRSLPVYEALQTLIPELAESEDERIRKVIYKLLLGMREEIFTSQDDIVTKDKVLAWLEKQKTYKPTDEDEKIRKDLITYLKSVQGETLDLTISVPKWIAYLEKQKESLHIPETCKENPDSFTDEDERIRKWIVEELEITRDAMSGKNDYSDDPDIVARLKRLDEAIYWLEKQKYPNEDYLNNPAFIDGFDTGREVQKIFDEQKPVEIHIDNPNIQKLDPNVVVETRTNGTEYLSPDCGTTAGGWSEEDRHAIENCEYAIKETFKDEHNPHRIGTLDWLKSLRPSWKPSDVCYGAKGDPDPAGVWKPSEEQMEHLQRAINCYESDWGENKVLRSVINELKKL